MTKTRSTKSALISSVIALLLCFAMLVGSTFAWFTDSVTSANNLIKSGNLDIELDYWDGDSWETVQGTHALFTDNLWEPGHTEVVYLKLSNLGTLALKYQLAISVLSETEGTNKDGKTFKLSDYIQMGVVADKNGETDAYTKDAAGRAQAIADAGETGIIGNGYIENGNMLAGDPELYMAVVVYMPENVGNEANAMTGTPAPNINLGVQVLATQYTAEGDSFDNQYDADATFGTYIELNAGDDLLAAMASAEADMPLTIKLNGDVEWPTEGHHGENDITPASSIVIDGNGYTITAIGAGVTPLGDQTAPMTLKNVTIVDNSVSYNEGAWEFTYLEIGGSSLTCNNVTFADEIQIGTNANFTNCSFESNEESVYAVWVEDGSATFNSCTFTGYRGLKMHEDYSTEISSVVVNNCTFKDITKKPGIAIGDLNADTTVSITGSTFINCQAGDQGNYIYETDTDVTTFNFNEENNTVIGGTEIVDGVYENGTRNYYVYTAEGLKNVFAEVIPQNREQSQSVNLMADIDLSGIIWQPINNMHFTFNGNGHTISNVMCAEGWRSGFFGYAGGVTVNDLSLENVTSAGAQAGTFAGSTEGLTANNCYLKGINSVTYVPYVTADYEETYGGIGAVTGVVSGSTINVTIVEGATVTLNKSGLTTQCTYIDNLTGYLNANSGTVVNNGTIAVAASASTQEALNSIVTSGDAVDMTLAAGNYQMPDGSEGSLRGKTITIRGTKDTVIDVSNVDARDQFVTGANIVFDGVTLNFGTVNYMGFANTANLTYKNCTINGLQFLFGNNVTFENCELNSNGAEHCVWTYGAQNVSFVGCDFTYGDRGINCYSDNDVVGGKQTVNFTNCTFATENTASKGAVEINSCYFSVGIEVNMEGCTAPAYGEMAYVSEWDSTNGAKTTINIK